MTMGQIGNMRRRRRRGNKRLHMSLRAMLSYIDGILANTGYYDIDQSTGRPLAHPPVHPPRHSPARPAACLVVCLIALVCCQVGCLSACLLARLPARPACLPARLRGWLVSLVPRWLYG